MALFCVQIDYFAMNLALPRMAFDLKTTAPNLQSVISVYMLALGAFMVPAGRCERADERLSVRACQSRDRVGLRHSGLGNAAGPLIGGLLTETVGWRWIFWLNVPLTLVVLAIGARSITESCDETAPRRIDVTGLALITVGIGLFTLTFDRAPSWGWLSAPMVIAFAGSLVALALFVAVEKRVRWPLVDLSLVQNPRFTLLVIAGTIANIAYGVTIFLSTMYLQEVRGASTR